MGPSFKGRTKLNYLSENRGPPLWRVSAQPEEHVAKPARGTLLAPDPAIEEARHRRDAIVHRACPPALGFDRGAFAGLLLEVELAEAEAIAVQQLGDLLGGRERLLLRAALLHC